VFNNAADVPRQAESSAMSNVETDAHESIEPNLSTQKLPTNGSSQSIETSRNQEVLNYSADSFNSLCLDTQLEGDVPEKVRIGTMLLVSIIGYFLGKLPILEVPTFGFI